MEETGGLCNLLTMTSLTLVYSKQGSGQPPHASCSWLTRSLLLVHLFNVSNVMQLAHDI
jgi:hypothetical protein